MPNISWHRANMLDYTASNCIGKRVLLVGVTIGDPELRAGATGTLKDKPYFGTQYDENIIGLRFFDSSTGELIRVSCANLKKFCSNNQVINASVHCSRPFLVTMRDGGRFIDLPRYDAEDEVAYNDRYVIDDSSFGSTALIVSGNGEHAFIPNKTLIEYRKDKTYDFYNF